MPRSRIEVVDRNLGWKELFKRGREIKDAYAKVGVLADSPKGGLRETGPDGKSSPLTVAEVAVVMEFGTRDEHVPARAFLRPTFESERNRLADMGKELISQVLDGKMDIKRALGLMGASLANSTKMTIQAGVDPPNAPSTALAKAKKGKTAKLFNGTTKTLGRALAQAGALAAVKPLIDTGRMIGAISWAVVMGNEKGAGE